MSCSKPRGDGGRGCCTQKNHPVRTSAGGVTGHGPGAVVERPGPGRYHASGDPVHAGPSRGVHHPHFASEPAGSGRLI